MPAAAPAARADALVGLMTQFQRQGKLEQAAQIAMQILRASHSSLRRRIEVVTRPRHGTAGRNESPGRIGPVTAVDRAHARAAQEYARLHRDSPDARRLLYGRCAQTDQAAREMARMLELKPDDDALRLRLAVDLASGGDTVGALGHYKAVFEKSPDLAAASFYQMLNLFDRAGKTTQLVEFMNGIDIKALSLVPYSYISRLLSFRARPIGRRAHKLRRCSARRGPRSPRAVPTFSGRHSRRYLDECPNHSNLSARPFCRTPAAPASSSNMAHLRGNHPSRGLTRQLRTT